MEFERTAYDRIGSATPRLADNPERQRALWDELRPYAWESGVAQSFVADEVVLERLDGRRRFAEMTTEERRRACYQHTVLRYLDGSRMRNATLRMRFGVAGRNSAQVSGVIRQALDANLIRPADIAQPRSGYVPLWA